MRLNRWMPAVAAIALVVPLVAGCSGDDAEDTTTTVATRSATTVGAVVGEVTTMETSMLESPLLAVEFADGTQAVISASAEILDQVGLGSDVIEGEITVVTWGNELADKPPGVLTYLLFEDETPDAILLEETSAGEWTVTSVEG